MFVIEDMPEKLGAVDVNLFHTVLVSNMLT